MPNTFDIGTIAQNAVGGAATQAASGLVGGLFGLMTEKHNDARQIRQQQALTDMQQKANQEQAKYSQELQLDTWNKTNYEAQIAHMVKAGLNPALLYGMSGGGGVTTGSASAQGVSGGSAPTGGGEIMGMMQMGLQADMVQSQIELNKANAANALADAKKKGGVDTELSQTQIKSLTQGIENQKAQEALTKIQTATQAIQMKILSDTQEDQTQTIKELAKQARETTGILESQNVITWDQAQFAYSAAEQNLISLSLQNDVKRKEIDLTNAQINQISQSIAQKWKEIQIQSKNANTQQQLMQLQHFIHDMPDSKMLIGKSLANIIGILGISATR